MSDYLTKIIQMLMIEEEEDNDDILILLALLLDNRRKERAAREIVSKVYDFMKKEANINYAEKITDARWRTAQAARVSESTVTRILSERKAHAMKQSTVPAAESNRNQDSPSSGNEIKVFCPKCDTEVLHTAEGIQQDQTKILVAKVYHYFEQEYEELKKMYEGLDLTPLSRFRQRTALATGVSETKVLEILKEEERRNADNLQEREPTKKRCRARKRTRQTDSSSDENSSDENVDDGGQSSFAELALKEPEIETLVVKFEPSEYYKEQPQSDPFSAEVKAEPPDDDVNNTNETLALNDPIGTKRKGRKISRTDVTSTRQHTQGEPSTVAASCSGRPTEQLLESGMFGGTAIKLEHLEIEEEEFT